MSGTSGGRGTLAARTAKRCLDLAAFVAAVPLLLPLGLCVAALVRWKIGRPVLFRQQRPGLDAELFEILKFRTMTDRRDAAGRLLSDAERLTPFGAWLRGTSLDELPEFINVLRGEMSLVGPRPLLVQYLDRYTPDQARRHEVKPGVTGWAQINGRNALTWEEKFELDLCYVDHHTLALDLRILMTTAWKVLRREGISARGKATMDEFMGNDGGR